MKNQKLIKYQQFFSENISMYEIIIIYRLVIYLCCPTGCQAGIFKFKWIYQCFKPLFLIFLRTLADTSGFAPKGVKKYPFRIKYIQAFFDRFPLAKSNAFHHYYKILITNTIRYIFNGINLEAKTKIQIM